MRIDIARRHVGAKTGLAVLAAGTLALALIGAPTAGGSIAHPTVVRENPANFTPNVVDGGGVANASVFALKQVGRTMFAGGAFRTVMNSARTETYTRNHLVAFSATSPGNVRGIAPAFDGPVWALAKRRSSLYVGGDFRTVDGISRRGLVKLDADTGAVNRRFRPAIPSGKVTELRLVDGRLLVGGTFPKKLVALNRRTGADTGYIDLPISGSVASNAGPTKVYRFAVSGNRLVAIGNFTSVNGQPRRHAFMLRLGASSASLSPWHPPTFDLSCSGTRHPAYLRDVDFSPNGNYFVVVSAGNVPRPGDINQAVCDAAARFETGHENATAEPTWINYTGGDTLHSTAVTGAAVYVQGHQRWLDNPFGQDSAGPGAVSRPGIGAINPVTGNALPWNPTKSREVGGKDFLATSKGLWVGSDGARFAGERRDGIAFCRLP